MSRHAPRAAAAVTPPVTPLPAVRCAACGTPADDFPQSVALLLNEDQVVELEQLTLEAGSRDLFAVIRGQHLGSFARWHG
jgi:hypothetical protein